MVGENNKILTVSYGTFSCTLEGFDDPFSTMRGIAEYFRDLAADDRYFGAEPPTPDVEMLQKIAEKEVQNRVEKKINDGGVILRQVADGTVTAEPAEDAKEASNVPFTSSDASTDSIAEAADAVEEVVADETPLEDEAFDEVAEAVEDHADDASDEETFEIEDEVEASDETNTEATQDEDTSEQEDAVEDVFADDARVEEDDAQEDVAEEVAEEPESEVAFETTEDSEPEVTEVTEEVSSQSTRVVSTPLEIFTERLESITADTAPEEPEETADFEETVEAAEVDVEEPVAADTSFEDKLARIQAAVAATPDFDDEFEAEAEAEPIAKMDDVSNETPMAFDEDAPEPDEAVEEDVAAFDMDVSDENEVSSDADAPSVPEGYEVAAEVVTLKRDDLVSDTGETDAPKATGADDTVSEDDIREVLGDTSLSDEDEQDLAATLARIEEAEVEEAVEEAAAEVAAEEAARVERTRPISRPLDERDENEGVSRLLEEADHQFQDDESSRRRSAIAHLKAAVAATKADDLIRAFKGGGAADEEEQSAYREDLNRVVKPQSSEDLAAKAAEEAAVEAEEEDASAPEEPALDSERPAPIEDQPAPLMLVSEQRVHGDEPSVDGASIRPKRIMADDEVEAPKDTGFVAFAEDMGAKDLPELLEAAAAYAAFVENEPHFSRPQLMRRVEKSHLAEDFSREAGLRTFGQLLRQGRLQKLKRGQFTVSSDSRFNPESRIAGE